MSRGSAAHHHGHRPASVALLAAGAAYPSVANVRAARSGFMLGAKPVTPLRRRIPMQVLFIAFALWTATGRGALRSRLALDWMR